MNWGKSIILAFILFALFIGVLVTVCVKQEVSLVSKDYYNEELAFQEHMEKEKNTEALAVKPHVSLTSLHQLKINIFDFNQCEKGQLVLYSPANMNNDKKFLLHKTSADEQLITIDEVANGKYVAKLTWTKDGKDYYYETVINI